MSLSLLPSTSYWMWKISHRSLDDIPPIADTGLMEVYQERLRSKCTILREISALNDQSLGCFRSPVQARAKNVKM